MPKQARCLIYRLIMAGSPSMLTPVLLLKNRASSLVRRRLEAVEHSMLLENQKVRRKNPEAGLDEFVRETNPRLFWD